jgi:hypothetical protein
MKRATQAQKSEKRKRADSHQKTLHDQRANAEK